MKTAKRFASLALVLILALALTLPAAAVSAGNDGSITIPNATATETYSIYEIFVLEGFVPVSGEDTDITDNAHSYYLPTDSAWRPFFAEGGAGAAYVTVKTDVNADNSGNYVEWKTGADAAAFAKAALAFATANSIAPTASITKDTVTGGNVTVGETNTETKERSITFSGLELGYYLIDSSLGAVCMLDTTNKNFTINDKNEKPTDKKEQVIPADKNEPGVGDQVEYKITIHAKPGATNYKAHDKMGTGLTFTAADAAGLAVTMGPAGGTQTPVADTNYDLVTTGLTDGCTFEVIFHQDFLDTITTNQDIIITYTATINEDAVTVDELTNTEKLTYGQNSETETEETEVKTKVYGFDLIKVKSDGTQLEGARFQLQDENENVITLVATAGGYRVAKDGETGVTEFTVGNTRIDGLGKGTYYLVELQAPTGYNKLQTPYEVTISADNFATEDGDGTFTGGIQVENLTGAELPSTGGIGTTIFYILGGLLVVGAGVVLITRKRVSADGE